MSAGASVTEGGPSAANDVVPRITWAVTVTVFTGFCLIALINVLALPVGPIAIAAAVLCMVALLSLHMVQIRWSEAPKRPWYAQLVLAAQACLVYLPLPFFEQAWIALPGFLAGSVLLALPGKLAWFTVAGVVASTMVAQSALSEDTIAVAHATLSTFITGLIVYGLSRLQSLIRELHNARQRLAEAAVARERLRFARDLHDILGHKLSAITLKTELAHKLVARHPQQARDELVDILESSRQALTDVRSVARGYRELSFDEECRSVRSVLTAAGVTPHMRTTDDELPTRIGTVLATVLREGVTNVLRHSRAEHCDIDVRHEHDLVTVAIENDGVAHDRPSAGAHSGSGLGTLTDRVAALGGTLTADYVDGPRFRLAVELPAPPDPTPADIADASASSAAA